VSDLNIIFDGGESSYSVAKLRWDGDPAVAVRWNGGDSAPFQGLGNPQSRGIPTWFILPDSIADLVKAHPGSLQA
jgi:hypothetical protein